MNKEDKVNRKIILIFGNWKSMLVVNVMNQRYECFNIKRALQLPPYAHLVLRIKYLKCLQTGEDIKVVPNKHVPDLNGIFSHKFQNGRKYSVVMTDVREKYLKMLNDWEVEFIKMKFKKMDLYNKGVLEFKTVQEYFRREYAQTRSEILEKMKSLIAEDSEFETKMNLLPRMTNSIEKISYAKAKEFMRRDVYLTNTVTWREFMLYEAEEIYGEKKEVSSFFD